MTSMLIHRLGVMASRCEPVQVTTPQPLKKMTPQWTACNKRKRKLRAKRLKKNPSCRVLMARQDRLASRQKSTLSNCKHSLTLKRVMAKRMTVMMAAVDAAIEAKREDVDRVLMMGTMTSTSAITWTSS